MPAKYAKTDPRRKSLYDAAPAKSATSTQQRATRARQAEAVEEETFEDRLDKPTQSLSKPASSASAKRKKVEWSGDDLTAANTAANRGRTTKAGAGEVKAEQPSKKRKANTVALPPPPPFPVVAASEYPALRSLSSATSVTLGAALAPFIQAVAAAESAALEKAYGESDAAGEHAFLSKYGRSALDGWAADVQKAMGAKSTETPKKGRGRSSTAAASDPEQADPSLPLYAQLASALSASVEQFRVYTQSLTSAASSAAALSPSLPASMVAFLSAGGSSESGSLPTLIRQGYSALSVDSDVLIGELRTLQEEVQQHKAWRENVSAAINKKVVGSADEVDEDEDDTQTGSGKKKQQVKRLIKTLTKDQQQ